MEGIGSVCWWGLAPACSLFPVGISSEEKDINILISGSFDFRHILATLGSVENSSSDPSGTIHFYLHENRLEVITRFLVMLRILSSPSLGMREKVEILLEIYGNLHVRQVVAERISDISKELIQEVVHRGNRSNQPITCDYSQLKYKDIDKLEEILRGYDSRIEYDVSKDWDDRLRRHFKDRYDSRANLIDWDHSMGLVGTDRRAGVIHRLQYEKWRMTGNAFEAPEREESSYSMPNLTLVSMEEVRVGGRTSLMRGYWGDIVQSPYVASSVETLPFNESFYKEQTPGSFLKNARDVVEHNLMSQLCQWIKGTQFKKGDADQERKEDEEMSYCGRRVFIHFIAGDLDRWMLRTSRKGEFHSVFVGCLRVQHIGPNLDRLLSTEGVMTIETLKWIIELKKESKEKFLLKVRELCDAVEWTMINSPTLKDNFISCRKK